MLELIHTSVPQGLKENSSGFCSVAWTAGMPVNLIPPLEQLCAYRALYPFGDAKYERNPVSIAYQRIRYGGTTLSVLGRIASAGLDYSGRNNKIAHQILLEKEETDVPDFSPVALCRRKGTFFTEWNRPPEELPRRHIAAPREIRTPALHWGRWAGSPAWAGVAAEHFLRNPARAVYVEYPEGFSTDTLLLLVAEITSLLTGEQEAAFTFNTYFIALPNGGSCFLRFCPKGSPALQSAERVAANPVIRLTEKNAPSPAQENSPWGIYAKTGIPPAARELPEKSESARTQRSEPRETVPVREQESGRKETVTAAFDPQKECMQAELFVLRRRLERNRRLQQRILGATILGVVIVAAVTLAFFLFRQGELPSDLPEQPPLRAERLPGGEGPGTGSEIPASAGEEILPDTRTEEKSADPEESAPPSPASEEKPRALHPSSGKAAENNVPKVENRHRITTPSSRNLFRLLEQLAAKIPEENSFTLDCPLPPELANANDIGVRLKSIGGNTSPQILGNLPGYLRKVPGGVRILSTAFLPRDGIYAYVPVPGEFLEITVANRRLHVAKKAGGNPGKIDSPRLMDIAFLMFRGSKEISVPFALTQEMIASLPFGTLERASENRHDFLFRASSARPVYFLYRKTSQEERLSSFITFRYASGDALFETLEQWNDLQQSRRRNGQGGFPDVEKLLKQIKTLKELLSEFEKEKLPIYEDTDPVTFGAIASCRDLKQADEEIRRFTRRKKQYENFIRLQEKRLERSEVKELPELFQRTRTLFNDLKDLNASNRNLLRNLTRYNLRQQQKEKQEEQEKLLRKTLLKQMEALPFVKQEKEKLKRVLTDRQPLALFRDGPNRNRTLEQHFTRTWVTRTVKEAPK